MGYEKRDWFFQNTQVHKGNNYEEVSVQRRDNRLINNRKENKMGKTEKKV